MLVLYALARLTFYHFRFFLAALSILPSENQRTRVNPRQTRLDNQGQESARLSSALKEYQCLYLWYSGSTD